MVSDKVDFDLSVDLEEGSYFKSCFARSVAVNSLHKYKEDVMASVKKEVKHSNMVSGPGGSSSEGAKMARRTAVPADLPDVKLRKGPRSSNHDDSRRFSCGSVSSSRRTSMCSSRITEIPVENIVHQSKIETLQWQLKEAEKSREMYRALMNQVVTFLERAHRSLEILSSKVNCKSVPRSKSEHQIVAQTSKTLPSPQDNATTCTEDYTAFRDFTWRRPKKQELSPEEVPPDRLAQDAFRLLRTVQSLLNTREPDLAHVTNDPVDDIQFLAQLAKEFPQSIDTKPQRTPSFSMSPKLLTPERETKLSTTFSRKLSLQLNDTRRYSHSRSRQPDSARGSLVDSEMGVEFNKDHRSSFICPGAYHAIEKVKSECEKSNSPPAGSVSSVEDESGFSSMNSFQDVGLPIVNSTLCDDVSPKNVILRSMLSNNFDFTQTSGLPASTHNPVSKKNEPVENLDDIKLWKKPDNILPSHKRWNSTPVADTNEKQPLKVLWV